MTYKTVAPGHVWLGLDPGLTTGWAVIADNGEVLGSGNLPVSDLERGLDELVRGLHRSGHAIDAVVERMPRVGGAGKMAKQMEDVWRALYVVVEATYEVPYLFVAPGEWKPSRVARTTKLKRGMTPHQRDAIRMTLYMMEKTHGK